MITETFVLKASDTDVLNAPSRLSSIPYAGKLVVEAQAATADAVNNFTLTVEMPDGTIPVNAQRVSAGATVAALNADDKWQMSFDANQGAHFTLAAVETGASTLILRVTLLP